MKKYLLALLWVGWSSIGFAQADSTVFLLDSSQVREVSQWRYQVGDRAEWCFPAFIDSAWQLTSRRSYLSEPDSIRWYRAEIHLQGEPDEYDLLALQFTNLAAAYEVYWDGQLILTNGKVANQKAAEIPGEFRKLVRLKQKWTEPGRHVLAVRLSTFHLRASHRYPWAVIGYSNEFQTGQKRFYYPLLFDSGIFFLAMIFSIALFLGGGQHRAYLLFAIFCFLNVLYAGISFALYHLSINVIYFPAIRNLSYLLSPIGANSLNLFFILNFNIPKKWLHLGAGIVISVLILVFTEHYYITFLSLYSAGLLIYAIRRKEPGSAIALIGLLVMTIFLYLYYQRILHYSYLFGEIAFLFCITLSISRQIKVENQLHQAAQIRSARLEAELLKKNIQPHFLMNTLLSIMSWIEENPSKAKQLIQALADEFRMINKISAQKEISIQEELKLCETHLKLMGCRMDAHYELFQENIDENETVPPMIFHTLIENGLTHAYQTGENGRFLLQFERLNGKLKYKLVNNGSLLAKHNQQSESKFPDGMGMTYIKARLEESYPKKWHIDYGLIDNQWEVNIYIQK